MKYKIKHETKKKLSEIIKAAEKKDESLYNLLVAEVESRAERIKTNLKLSDVPKF